MAVWALWGVSWLAAWGWTARTEGAAGRARQAPYRIINIAGFACLFAKPFLMGVDSGGMLARPLWRLPEVVGWGTVALSLAGFLFAWSARIALGRYWSAAVTRKAGHRVVGHGPYSVVRHPIYTGLLTGAIALALAQASALGLLGLALLLVGYTVKARLEERFLAEELGRADYAAYRARVPMLVPFARF